jgi:hypothetical protein
MYISDDMYGSEISCRIIKAAGLILDSDASVKLQRVPN